MYAVTGEAPDTEFFLQVSLTDVPVTLLATGLDGGSGNVEGSGVRCNCEVVDSVGSENKVNIKMLNDNNYDREYF